MSVDATKWAWSLSIPPSRKIVLLSMADRAGETHTCWPSVARLEADTCLDRKTILASISDLESMGLIKVSRSIGAGNSYQLQGVNSRENIQSSPKNGTAFDAKPVPKTEPVPITGPVPKTELHQSQKRDSNQSQKRDTEPTIEPKRTQTLKKVSDHPDGFDEFYLAYPKKVGKPAALKAFRAEKINGNLPDVLADVNRRKASHDWQKNNGQFIPNPSTYLNQRRWEDGQTAAASSFASAGTAWEGAK